MFCLSFVSYSAIDRVACRSMQQLFPNNWYQSEVSKVTTTTTRFEVEKLDGSRFLLLKKRVTSPLIQEGDKVMALRV